MTTDIMIINNTKGINNKNAVLSTTRTGYSSIRTVRPNYPVNLTISNIENKFKDRFDDITYYTIGNATIS
jgi:hypothetical protein